MTDVCFERSTIENTDMIFLHADGLWFIATPLRNINFVYSNIQNLCVEQVGIMGDGLNFNFATITKGRFRGTTVSIFQQEGRTPGVTPYNDNVIKIPLGSLFLGLNTIVIQRILVPQVLPVCAPVVGITNLCMLHSYVEAPLARERSHVYDDKNINSGLFNSQFSTTKFDEVCFSNLKFINCQHIESIRGAAGVVLQNVVSSNQRDLTVFRDNGASVDDKFNEPFRYYWINGRQQEEMRQQMAREHRNSNQGEETRIEQVNSSRPSLITYDQAAYQALMNGERNMAGKNLSGAVIHAIDLINVDFTGANLSNASFKNVVFMGTTLNRTNFTGAKFENVAFRGVTIDQNSSFKEANLEHVLFVVANLKNVSFANASLHNVDFFNSQLQENIDMKNINANHLEFVGCTLANISFKDAKLTNLLFRGTETIGTNMDFSEATLDHCCCLAQNETVKSILRNANFYNTKMHHCFFYNTRFDQCSLQAVSGKELTTIFEAIESSNSQDLEGLKRYGAKVNGGYAGDYARDRWKNLEPDFFSGLVHSFRQASIPGACTAIGTATGGPIGAVIGAGVGAGINYVITYCGQKNRRAV